MNHPTPTIALLYNSSAGKGKATRIVQHIENHLSSHSLFFHSFQNNWPTHFNSFTDIWLVGGDGTLNFFINQYPDTKLPISLFTGGSGNDFAWKLYGNKNLHQQIQIALNALPSPTDAAICNNKYFINGLGIGFDGAVVQSMGSKKIISAGHLAYLYTVIKKIFSFKFISAHISANNFSWSGHSFMITIANGSRYGGGFMVAPQADISDGLLDVIILPEIAISKRFFYLPKVENGKHFSLAAHISAPKN